MNLADIIRHPAHRVARLALVAIAFALVAAVSMPRAHAQVSPADIEKVIKAAMENYDNFDTAKAKEQLQGAINLAMRSDLENDPVLAKVYVNLAVVCFSGESDTECARDALAKALAINPGADFNVLYKSKELDQLLEEVRAEVVTEPGPSESSADCSSIEGLEHTIVDAARADSDLIIQAQVGSDLGASDVSLYYRFHGGANATVEFNEVPMIAEDGCTYRGTIPGPDIISGVIHYYIVAKDEGGAELASRGGERTPNIVEIEIGSDDPFGAGKKRGAGGPSGPAKIFVSVAAGTGTGLVTGKTEQQEAPVNAGFAPALLHLFPEVGYYLSPKASISAALRLGFPIGANIDNHATAAIAGIIRYRQSLSEDGMGLFVSGALGGGMIRQTITLADVADETMNVDITTIGPLFVGGGGGYALALSDSMRLVAELGALVGIPVVKSMGPAPVLNFGVQFDLNVGIVLSF